MAYDVFKVMQYYFKSSFIAKETKKKVKSGPMSLPFPLMHGFLTINTVCHSSVN